MSCDVCIPWRGTTPERERIFRRVRAWWESNGFRVVTGDSGHACFNRAASRNVAVESASTEEVVVADADTIPADVDNIHRAVVLAQRAMVYPFDEYVCGTDDGSGSFRAEWVKRDAPGGMFAINREAYRSLGGQDARFTAWGFEDDAFLLVARELHKVVRLRGAVYAYSHAEERDWSERNPGHARLDMYRRLAEVGQLREIVEWNRRHAWGLA